MKAYYTPSKGFIYVELTNDEGKDVVMIDEGCMLSRQILSHEQSKEYHLTTDGSWDLYYDKRLREPSLVKIFKTQNDLNEALGTLGFRL